MRSTGHETAAEWDSYRREEPSETPQATQLACGESAETPGRFGV